LGGGHALFDLEIRRIDEHAVAQELASSGANSLSARENWERRALRIVLFRLVYLKPQALLALQSRDQKRLRESGFIDR
jgi:hypothetical protein